MYSISLRGKSVLTGREPQPVEVCVRVSVAILGISAQGSVYGDDGRRYEIGISRECEEFAFARATAAFRFRESAENASLRSRPSGTAILLMQLSPACIKENNKQSIKM